MWFDRFDYYEAAWCVAHDYGCYFWFSVIRTARQFKPRRLLKYHTLSPNGLMHYHEMIAKNWHNEAGTDSVPLAWLPSRP